MWNQSIGKNVVELKDEHDIVVKKLTNDVQVWKTKFEMEEAKNQNMSRMLQEKERKFEDVSGRLGNSKKIMAEMIMERTKKAGEASKSVDKGLLLELEAIKLTLNSLMQQ